MHKPCRLFLLAKPQHLRGHPLCNSAHAGALQVAVPARFSSCAGSRCMQRGCLKRSLLCCVRSGMLQVLTSGPAFVMRWPAGWHRLAWRMQQACATSALATLTRYASSQWLGARPACTCLCSLEAGVVSCSLKLWQQPCVLTACCLQGLFCFSKMQCLFAVAAALAVPSVLTQMHYSCLEAVSLTVSTLVGTL